MVGRHRSSKHFIACLAEIEGMAESLSHFAPVVAIAGTLLLLAWIAVSIARGGDKRASITACLCVSAFLYFALGTFGFLVSGVSGALILIGAFVGLAVFCAIAWELWDRFMYAVRRRKACKIGAPPSQPPLPFRHRLFACIVWAPFLILEVSDARFQRRLAQVHNTRLQLIPCRPSRHARFR